MNNQKEYTIDHTGNSLTVELLFRDNDICAIELPNGEIYENCQVRNEFDDWVSLHLPKLEDCSNEYIVKKIIKHEANFYNVFYGNVSLWTFHYKLNEKRLLEIKLLLMEEKEKKEQTLNNTLYGQREEVKKLKCSIKKINSYIKTINRCIERINWKGTCVQ